MVVAILTTDNREFEKNYGCERPYFGTAPAALFQGLAGAAGVNVHVVSCAQQRMKSPDKLAENIFFHSLVVPKAGWMRTFYSGCVRAIRGKLREINPDLVHGQGTERECAISAVFSGHPNVLTLHGNMRQVARALGAKPLTFHWLAGHLEAFALRRTGGVVCLTNYTRRNVESLARKTWVVPNAVDESFYSVQRQPAAQPIVLCVANVHPYKNQNELIRALDPVAAEKKIRLVLVGSASATSPYGREFLELAAARPWCEFKGPQTGDALKAHLAAAALLVLPTLEDNCPMVVLEAMAAGLPVAASRIGGVPDLIDHDVDGLLFAPQNPAEIREAVLQLLFDPEKAARLAAAAKKRSLEKHHPLKIAGRHMDIYREVIGARNG